MIEAAPSRLPAVLQRLGVLPLFLGLIFLGGALGGPLRGLLPVYVDVSLGQPPAFSSALLSLLLVGAGAFAVVGGALADRLGPKRTLLLGTGWLLPAALLFSAADPPLLLGAALAAGLVDGLYVVGGQSYLFVAAPRGQLGLASALFFVGSTLGTSLGSLAAGSVVDRWGFGAFAGVLVAGTLALAVTGWRVLPEAAPGRPSRARASVGETLRSYLRLARQREMLLVACIRFLPTCYWGAATVLMPLLLYRLSGSVFGASLYLSVSLALAAGCQLLTGRLSDRVGMRGPVAVLTLLLPLAALATALATGAYWPLFAAGVFATCVAWSISVTFPPLVRELAPEGEHGRALGLLHLLWVVAMVLGANLGGRLIELDPAIPFAIGAAINVPTALVGLALARRLGTGSP